jgi:hypothetical protein
MRSLARLVGGLSVGVLSVALLAGCSASGGTAKSKNGTGILKAGLPPAAKMVSEGTSQLTYTPEEHGTVFLYDVTQDLKLGQYTVRRGQRFAMDGINGRATLDGNEVRSSQTKKNDSYQIYFLPSAEQ